MCMLIWFVLIWLCACFIFACHPLALPGILCLFFWTEIFGLTFSTVEPIRTERPPRPRYPMTAKEPMVLLRYLHDICFSFLKKNYFSIFSIAARVLCLWKLNSFDFVIEPRLICIIFWENSIAGSQTVGRPSPRRRARMTWTIWNRNWTSMTIKSPSRSCTNDSEPTRRP